MLFAQPQKPGIRTNGKWLFSQTEMIEVHGRYSFLMVFVEFSLKERLRLSINDLRFLTSFGNRKINESVINEEDKKLIQQYYAKDFSAFDYCK